MKHKYPAICDCGRPATHKYEGWECDRCKRLRLEWNEIAYKLAYNQKNGRKHYDALHATEEAHQD